jgi:hypothetical protein
MEQRRLRLGDILDDYCPRERRVTNHAVVAMIDEDVKQTRCTTCDAEHAYKGGKAPRRRKKETPGALYKEVLAGMSENALPQLSDPSAASDADAPEASAADERVGDEASLEAAAERPMEEVAEPGDESIAEDLLRDTPAVEDGPVHRPLIRATLPRPEGQKEARPLPEFTVRHSGNRAGNGNYRDARMKHRGGSGPRAQGGQRFAGPRGNGRGPGGRIPGGGFRSAQGPRHGGRKRSR